MKKTGEGLEQGEEGVTRLSGKLSFPSANVTDCDDAHCHIAVPVNTVSWGRRRVHVNTQKKTASVLVANRDYHHSVLEVRNRTVSAGRRYPENRKERARQAER